jgi:hypothetical protein
MAAEAPQREGSVPLMLFLSRAKTDSCGNAPGVPHYTQTKSSTTDDETLHAWQDGQLFSCRLSSRLTCSGSVPFKLLFDKRLQHRKRRTSLLQYMEASAHDNATRGGCCLHDPKLPHGCFLQAPLLWQCARSAKVPCSR